jgi:hypothetical protein
MWRKAQDWTAGNSSSSVQSVARPSGPAMPGRQPEIKCTASSIAFISPIRVHHDERNEVQGVIDR